MLFVVGCRCVLPLLDVVCCVLCDGCSRLLFLVFAVRCLLFVDCCVPVLDGVVVCCLLSGVVCCCVLFVMCACCLLCAARY